MSVKAVIGLGFGDEGKGVTTEYLCSQDPDNTVVVRFSGGQQAGHKVIKGEIEHVFSSIGSGALSGCPTYWSEYCTFDPVCFWNEYQVLKEKGIEPKVYIHSKAAVTTFFDVLANRMQDSDEIKHGTTGTGFFRTKKRHQQFPLFVEDILLFPMKGSIKLRFVSRYYGFRIEKEYIDAYHEATSAIRSLLNKSIFVTDTIPDYKHKVFEGSQGLLLDEHIGYMPHCTPSDVTPRPILNMGYDLDEVYLVTRAYQTRHGSGPMTNEEFPISLSNTEKETNTFNKHQGKFRTSILDLDQLLDAKRKGIDSILPLNTKVNLVITCLDQITDNYSLTHEGYYLTWQRDTFVKYIKNILDINGDLYINDSPLSTSIRKVKCE